MKIVIDIDEGIAQGIIDGKNDEPRNIVRAFQATIADAIKNGTPLPEHHGRLIDADKLYKIREFTEDEDGELFTYIPTGALECAQTIIEADGGGKNDK